MKRKRNNDVARPSSDKSQPNGPKNDVVSISQEWEAPLPPPSILERYGEIVEDGAARIFRQWEMETAHRREYEQKALRGHILLDGIGRVTAFVFSMTALGATVYAASIGEAWVAGVLGGGTIAAVAAALVYKGNPERQGGTK